MPRFISIFLVSCLGTTLALEGINSQFSSPENIGNPVDSPILESIPNGSLWSIPVSQDRNFRQYREQAPSVLLYQESQIDTFVDVWREYYDYNASGDPIEIIREWYLEDPLISDFWDVYQYNDEGEVRYWFRRVRIWPSADWLDWERGYYSYDSQNRLDTIYFEARYESWEPAVLIDFNHSESGDTLEVIQQGWLPQSQIWANAYRETYTYTNGLLSNWYLQSWGDGDWRNSQLHSYAYGSSGLLTEHLRFSWQADLWTEFRRYLHDYDESGYRIETITQGSSLGIWSNLSRDAYSYDESGNYTEWLTQNWENEAWENYFQVLYAHNSQGDRDNWLRQFWSNDHWSDYGRMIYSYDYVSVDEPRHRNEPLYFDLPVKVFPNPANSSTSIDYQVPQLMDISIAVYDLSGREVWSREFLSQPPGQHTLHWDGRNTFGDEVNSGVYILSLTGSGWSRSTKLIVLR